LDFASTNPDSSFFSPGGPSTLININNVLAVTDSTVLQFGGFDVRFHFRRRCVGRASVAPEPASLALLGWGWQVGFFAPQDSLIRREYPVEQAPLRRGSLGW